MSLKIVIIGGVAAGMGAATRARRLNEEASIIVLEKNGFVSFANCGLPYYVSGRIPREKDLLVTTPESLRQRYKIDSRVHHEVTRIDRAQKCLEGIDHDTNRPFTFDYDKLIIATGALPIIPPIAHVRAPNVFLLRTMEDTKAVRAWLDAQSPKSAVIVGAGFIGLEMAEALRDRGMSVTLLEKFDHVLPPLDKDMAAPVEAELLRHQVRVITSDGLKAFHARENGQVSEVETESGKRLAADVVLLSIGVRPNVALATAAGLKIGASGAIAVDQFQRTSDPDIYAVGDVSEIIHGVTGQATKIPLAGPANRQGRLGGEHAGTGSSAPAGKVLGSAIVQVFDLCIAVTGLNEDSARQSKIDFDTAYVLPKDHAGYYPGARSLRIKLLYEKSTGRVLGAQVVGEAGVDKRIDVIATAMHFGGTIDDLASLDLAYAPQFASAKDAVHLAAMVAQNQRAGIMPSISVNDLDSETLIDVRTPGEFAKGSLVGAKNIPVDELRDRIGELDPANPTVAFCQVGQRGYVAERILQQHGFANVRNLKGGYSLAVQSGLLRADPSA